MNLDFKLDAKSAFYSVPFEIMVDQIRSGWWLLGGALYQNLPIRNEHHLTLMGKSWKTHPEIFLKFQFSGLCAGLYYWKTDPGMIGLTNRAGGLP